MNLCIFVRMYEDMHLRISARVGDVVPGAVVWPSIFHIHTWIEWVSGWVMSNMDR